MRKHSNIQKWQLLRWNRKCEVADLSSEDFVTVGKKVFSRHRRLEEVRFPPSLSAVKYAAFRNCRRLRSVFLPEANSVGISASAFKGCDRLHRVEHSALLTVLGESSFSGCRALTAMEFGRELRRIGERAFYHCRSLTEISIPSCVEEIGSAAFAGCWDLERVELEEGLTVLSPGMFRQCLSLQNCSIPSSVRVLPANLFRDCSGLREVTLPGTVQRVGASSFRGCRRLESAVLDLGTVEIGSFAFAGDPALRSVTIPHSLKKLSFGAFGLGRSKEKIVLSVDNEYMLRRLRRQLFWCGSAGRTVVCMNGKTLEERKRERHRSSLEQQAAHIS